MLDETSFFDAAFELTLAEIAARVPGAALDGDGARSLDGVCSAREPRANALTFVERACDLPEALAQVGALFVRPADIDKVPPGPVRIITDRPQAAFASLVRQWLPASAAPGMITGQVAAFDPAHAPAHVAADALIEDGVVFGPGAVVGSGAQIGSGTIIGPNAVIGARCRIGRHCRIGAGTVVQYLLAGDGVIMHPNVSIGQDGFGYVPGPAGLEKMPQIGRVIIQDRVEIGAGTTIDRGTLGDTVIGEGSVIDNLVQIAHNVQLGRFVVLCAYVGLSGSCTVGDGAMLGGRAGIADHINIGAGAQVAAASGVMTDIPAGERWAGLPAQPARSFFREQATLRRLAKAPKS